MNASLNDWVGRTETVADLITPEPCAALAAMLNRSSARPATGAVLPPLWHWLYFLPLHRQSELGADGHPQRGGFLPPVPLPRRMWAGSQLQFQRPIHVGDELVRLSTIESVKETSGRSGPLVFVRVRHEIRRGAETDIALTEWQDIVYREAVSGNAVAAPVIAPRDSRWQREVRPDELLLFRYSALTFNGHRIHYDQPYATQIEGYPGLVVHGPLIATLLLDLLREHQPDADLASFEFRAIRPLFAGRPFQVCAEPQEEGRRIRLWARDQEGALAMDAAAAMLLK